MNVQEPIVALDRALTELGFERQARVAQASWRGQWNGRYCVVRVAPQRRTRYSGEERHRTTLGFRLRVELETRVRTQLFFVRASITKNFVIRQIYKWRRQTVVAEVPDAMRGFAAVTIEPSWAREYLSQTDAMTAIAQLLLEDAQPTFAGSVYLAPTSKMGKLYYASPIIGPDRLTGARVRSVLERLESAAAAAERISPPQAVHKVGAFGRFSEEHP